jgi:mRNA interferase YafQ
MAITENRKYKVFRSKKFLNDIKLFEKRGYDIKLLDDVVEILSEGKKLPAKYKDHALKGDYKGMRECHILPDWLLIYEIDDNVLYLYLSRTGTHSDLF